MDKIKVYNLKDLNEIRSDDRGWIAQIENFARSHDFKIKSFYVGTILPGKARGNHYHLQKKEWIFIFGGKYIFAWEDEGVILQREIGEEQFLIFEVKNGCAHAIKNISDKQIFVCVFNDQAFDQKKADTYKKNII